MERMLDVAHWFLGKSAMSHKKLQKLCYYAQAWYCALKDENGIFEDEIQAWVHGPVVVNLYPLYADFGWNPIQQMEFDDSVLQEDSKEILEAVYETYGGFSGDQLETLSHSEDPWIQARGNLKPWEPGNSVITHKAMKDYYSRLFKDYQNV